MMKDPWLTRWLPLAVERAAGAAVLEIGCGHGDDTAVLAGAGLTVQAFDLSAASLAVAKLRVPSARFEQRDIRDPLPLAPASAGLVVASLSLHYFPWTQTVEIVRGIHAVLRPGGLLLCRLNSTEDGNFGARGHPEIERHYYRVDGEPKRFFDRADAAALFADGWKRLSLEHFHTRKYVRSKALWEVVLERI
jgi:SAM-dependent methyltransferase